MIKKIPFSILILFCFYSAYGQTYITHVTLADVENHKLIQDQTVLIAEDLIVDIQPSKKIKVPENATVIDGKGKYLLPGLTDAHVHFFQNGGLYTRPDVIDLRKHRPYHKEISYAHKNMEPVLDKYLQNGITNLIDVGATYNFLNHREDFKSNQKAPSVSMTGPLLTTYQPSVYKNLEDDRPFRLTTSVEAGVSMVQEQLPFQPDFIKIWFIVGRDGLDVEASARKNLPIVKAIIDEAHKNNLKVAVHATQRITAQLAVESGADFLVHSVEDEIINKDFVGLLKKNKTILCPTLTVYQGYNSTLGQRFEISDHDLQKADPFQLGTLLDLRHLPDTTIINSYKTRMNSKINRDDTDQSNAVMMTNLKLLSDAGVLIATGTDAGNIGTLHASSYLSELQAMKKSGMSTWQIITASTLNGAKVLNQENEFGSIEVGKKANLILLDQNPVSQIENLTQINTVINNGLVFKPSELSEDSPEDLAQRQLNAYNLRNIEAFLEPYAEDVEVYTYPDVLNYVGKDKMREGYAKMFQNVPNLHCELKERIVQGNIVIDKERVRFGDKIVEAVAIYHIENNKIKKVYFIQ